MKHTQSLPKEYNHNHKTIQKPDKDFIYAILIGSVMGLVIALILSMAC
jgi:hypothetical protein